MNSRALDENLPDAKILDTKEKSRVKFKINMIVFTKLSNIYNIFFVSTGICKRLLSKRLPCAM